MIRRSRGSSTTMPMSCSTAMTILFVLLIGPGRQTHVFVAGFQASSPMLQVAVNTVKTQQKRTLLSVKTGSPSGSRGRSRLYYRNETIDATQDLLLETTVAAAFIGKNANDLAENQMHTTQSSVNAFSNDDSDIAGFMMSSFLTGRREVDRQNLHPLYKLGWVKEENFPRIQQFLFSAAVSLVVVGAVFSPILAAVLPVLFVAVRKTRWQRLVGMSKAEHQAAFEATTNAYRREQRELVDQLLLAQEAPAKLPSCVAVTMATGQEGQGVVRALTEQAAVQSNDDGRPTTILALVRDPASASARALVQLSSDNARVELVQCDSTDAASLQQALQPAEAVYLCTTLNRANAGKWSMRYDSGQYQVSQGQAFVEACEGLPLLKHVVYGTAPLRKWPSSFLVEPPIHYAAKWRVEQLLTEAKVPTTFLRKCPYHENFTKLTKAKTSQKWGVEGGGAFDAQRKVELQPGHYQIKAFTPDEFVYNMMDPRDAGRWAVLVFQNPSVLIGKSLSVASDALRGPEMAKAATECGALGDDVTFSYSMQPRWLFEALAFVEPTFVYISGLQRWSSDGGQYDLDEEGVQHVRKLLKGNDFTWCDHLEREGLGQFTETMADLLPDYTKAL